MTIIFEQIIRLCLAKPIQIYDLNYKINTICLDSRKLFVGSESVFVALAGSRHNSHELLAQIYTQGCRNFIVEQQLSPQILAALPEANVCLVTSSIMALQALAAYKRSLVSFPVIALTGSNGKTIVKEWLAALAGDYYNIVKSPGSYNSQTGVPLSVWQIEKTHNLGIFEAGISLPNEMLNLQKVIKPTIGVFTNIGSAHGQGFENLQHKTDEKMLLFLRADTLIWHDIYPQIRKATSLLPDTCRLLPWTFATKNNVITLFLDGFEPFEAVLPVLDTASVENLLHVIAACLILGLSAEQIHQQIKKPLPAVSMRLELKKGTGQSYVIDDSYSYDLAGLALALDFMHEQNQTLKAKKVLILSDLPDSFMPPASQHEAINKLLTQHKIDTLIAVGTQISQILPPQNGYALEVFGTVNDFLTNYNTRQLSHHLILVKGGRKFAFEQIVDRLEEKIHGTRLDINLSALVHNLNFYKSLLDPKTRLMVMVKALAYGSGGVEIANLLAVQKVDYLAVAYPDEGVSLRNQGIMLPIMVMNPNLQSIDVMIRYRLEPAISTFSLFISLINHIKMNLITAKIPIHLELDTGMNRLGFMLSDWAELQILLAQSAHLFEIKSIFSHLAAADEAVHDDFTKQQINDFDTASTRISDLIGYKPLRHILNSAGIVRFAQQHLDMVRLGIGLYGLEMGGMFQNELRNVSSLKTTISQIRHINAGESIGYGRSTIVSKPTTVATLAIGYADGLSRSLGNGRGWVYINGQKAPILGNVCMDMCMADTSSIEAKEGDQAIIFDSQSRLNELAHQAQTIAYEILTSISQRVKRIYFKE